MPEGHVLHRAARCRGGASAASRSGRRHRRDVSPTERRPSTARPSPASTRSESISSTGSTRATSCTCISDCSANSGFGRCRRRSRRQRSARHGDRDRSSAPRRPDGVRAHHPGGRGRSPRSTRSGSDPRSRRWSRRTRAPAQPPSISIGAALLDQKVVAGIGNVYRSELLFLAGIHPLTVAKSLEPGPSTTSGVGRWSHSRTARRWARS